MKFELAYDFPLHDFGGSELFIYDINGDGRPELLWLQALGTLSSKIYRELIRKFRHLQKVPELFCLTATDARGNVLWQYGSPWSDTLPFPSHAAESMVDFASTPKGTEIVCANGSCLFVFSNEGRLLRKANLPADNFHVVKAARHIGRYRVLAKNSVESYPPHTYGNPVLFYDSSLKLMKEWHLKGAGHLPYIFDADNDGNDEYIVGYNLISDNLDLVWTLDYWRGRQLNPTAQHVDCIDVVREGKDWHVIFAGSDALYRTDSLGRLLWRLELPHPQYVKGGRFGADGQAVFVTNCAWHPAALVSLTGKILWAKKLPEHWPNGKPRSVASRSMHLDIPFSIWTGVERDLIIYHEQGWPYILSGNGSIDFSIPCPKDAVQKPIDFPGFYPDRYGFGYRTRVADLDGNNAPNIVVYDRNHAWVFHPE
jgi:hypothetical protein